MDSGKPTFHFKFILHTITCEADGKVAMTGVPAQSPLAKTQPDPADLDEPRPVS